jgi:hypothetical protein
MVEEMTYGQRAVGMSFNPSQDPMVLEIKQNFAEVIDAMDQLRDSTADSEVKRLASVAITEAQTAQMWAVKALTFNK